MEVTMRKILDYSTVPNLSKLKPFSRILSSFVLYYMSSNTYKNKVIAKHNKIYEEMTTKDDKFKQDIQVIISRELQESKSFRETKDIAKAVVISVSAEYLDSIERVLGIDKNGIVVKDIDPTLSAYHITRIEEDKDIRLAIPNLDILLRVELRKVGDEF